MEVALLPFALCSHAQDMFFEGSQIGENLGGAKPMDLAAARELDKKNAAKAETDKKGPVEWVTVPCRPLDAVLKRGLPIVFVKIDVEGSEDDLIGGAKGVFEALGSRALPPAGMSLEARLPKTVRTLENMGFEVVGAQNCGSGGVEEWRERMPPGICELELVRAHGGQR